MRYWRRLPDDAPHADTQSLHERLGRVQRDLSEQLRIVHAIGLSTRDFIYMFDRDLRFIYVSPPLLKLWNRTLAEVIGKNFADLGYPAELVALHRRQLEQALSGQTVSGANAYVNHEGIEGQYEYTFVPVAGEDGRVETIVGTTRDITGKLALESERAAALAELQNREAQFRQFADAIPQLAWMARADGYIFWYNQRWYEYTGTTPAEMEGWGWQAVHDPVELSKVMESWQGSVATGEPFEMAFPLRSAAGTFRLFLTRVQPILGPNGEVSRWFGTNTDIESQRQAIADRDAALASANEANRAKDEFLAMLGHELRNPLSPMVTALELLKRRGATSREHEIIERQVRHLSRLVGDLLDVARITQGKVELQRGRTEIQELLRRAAELASPLLEKRGQRLTVSVAPGARAVFVDPDRMAQVISNLLSNASQFSPPAAEIALVSDHAGDIVRIRVCDRGIGLAPEMLERVFEPFIQQGQAIDRARGGLGLGLSIVKNLVHLHGGAVYARSAGLGNGSEFVVELPMVPAFNEPSTLLPERAPAERAVATNRRVLVVDDNRDAADLLAEFLITLDLEVRVAHDPPSALDLAAQFRPEVAVLDIGLPVIDGWELGRRLRELPGSGRVTLIAVTGYGQDGDRQRSEEAGFAAHLVKPVDLQALTGILEAGRLFQQPGLPRPH